MEIQYSYFTVILIKDNHYSYKSTVLFKYGVLTLLPHLNLEPFQF